jgi:hypothetical protein
MHVEIPIFSPKTFPSLYPDSNCSMRATGLYTSVHFDFTLLSVLRILFAKFMCNGRVCPDVSTQKALIRVD